MKTWIGLRLCLITVSLVTVVYSLFLNPTIFHLYEYWPSEYRHGFIQWLSICSLLGFGLKYTKVSEKRLIFLASVILLLAIGVGLFDFFAVCMFVFSCYALGCVLLGLECSQQNTNGWVLRLCTGLLVLTAVYFCLIFFPINYKALYWLLLLLPVVLFARIFSFDNIGQGLVLLDQRLSSIPYLLFCCSISFIGFVASNVFLKHVTSDDAGLHLSIYTQLDYYHKHLFDVRSQIWSVAPFAVDLYHAICSLIVGHSVKPAFNLVVFIGLCISVYSNISMVVRSDYSLRIMLLVLFVSTPIVSNLLLGLQTDLFLALLFSMALNCIVFSTLDVKEALLSVVVFSGLFLAVKLPAALISLSLCCVVYFRYLMKLNFRDIVDDLWLLRGHILVALFVALYTYVVAFLITGNPFFPLYNGIFKSEFYDPVNILDTSFNTGFNLKSYWGMFFNTDKHLESLNYTAGFQFFLLFPFGFFAALMKSWRIGLALLICVALYGVFLFSQMQYVRYFFIIYPGMMCFIAYLVDSDSTSRFFSVFVKLVLVFYFLLNLNFMPGASWVLAKNNVKEGFAAGKGVVAPEHEMNEYVYSHYGEQKVIYDVARAYGATLKGVPIYYNWYSPFNMKIAGSWNNPDDARTVLLASGVQFVYWYEPLATNNDFFRPRVKSLIDAHGEMLHEIDGLKLYRIKP